MWFIITVVVISTMYVFCVASVCMGGGGGVALDVRLGECFFFSSIFLLLFSLPPEGLKKVRNPDRMYRSAVCYAGHGPPKSISDDTETNSKSQLLILHCRSERPLAGQSIIHSSIHLFTSWFHPFPCPPPPPPPSPPPSFLYSPPTQHILRLLCWLKCLLSGITLSIAEVLSLTKSDCFRLRPGDQDPSGPSERKAHTLSHQLWPSGCLFLCLSLPPFSWRRRGEKKKNTLQVVGRQNIFNNCRNEYPVIFHFFLQMHKCLPPSHYIGALWELQTGGGGGGGEKKDNTTS